MRSPYREAIRSAAIVVGLDARLVEAVVLQESGGRADAFRYEAGYFARYLATNPRFAEWEPRRVASSYGLMQVMYPTALDLGFRGEPEELFRIALNLQLGSTLLAKLLARFAGSVPMALAAYNGGPGNVQQVKPRRYAEQVLGRYRALTAGEG